MTIYTSTQIACNECHYEHPNDYYFGVKEWIFVLIDGEEYHFCRQECLNFYLDILKDIENWEQNENNFQIIKKVEDNSRQMKDILKTN
jgi:hypothetical protein